MVRSLRMSKAIAWLAIFAMFFSPLGSMMAQAQSSEIKPQLNFNSPIMKSIAQKGVVKISLTVDDGMDVLETETAIGPGETPKPLVLPNLPKNKVLLVQAAGMDAEGKVIKTIKTILGRQDDSTDGKPLALVVNDTTTLAADIAILAAKKAETTVFDLPDYKIAACKERVNTLGLSNLNTDASKNNLAQLIKEWPVEILGQSTVGSGGQVSYSATEIGLPSTDVKWYVGNVENGNPGVGTISSDGTYKAPTSLPKGQKVIIKAVCKKDEKNIGTKEIAIEGKPEIPGNLRAAAVDSAVTLNWTAVEGATGYRVYTSTQNGQFTQAPVTVSDTNCTINSLNNGTIYYFAVSAYNASGESDKAQISATPEKQASKPDAPGNLRAIENDREITITWSAVEGATSYKVYQGTTLGQYGQPVTVSGATYTASNLTNGTTYYFAVSAVNSVGEGDTRALVSGVPKALTASLAPPDAGAAGDDQMVAISWEPVEGAVEYNVYRVSPETTQPSTLRLMASGLKHISKLVVSDSGFVGTTSGTDFDVHGLTNGQQYYFMVTSTNKNLESDEGSVVSAIPNRPEGKPDAPVNLAATGDDSKATLKWDAVDGATEYHIYKTTQSGTYANHIASTSSTNYVINGLINGTKYYFVVTAQNSAGESIKSTEADVTPTKPIAIPNAPSISVTPGDGKVTLSWDGVEGAASYKVYKRTADGQYGSAVATTAGRSFSVSGLTNGTTYYFAVSAVNTAGEGVKSNEVSGTPQKPPAKPAMPGDVKVSVDDARADVSWAAVDGATEYKIYRSTTSGSYGEAVVTTKNIAYRFTGLTNGTTYYFVVSAVNSMGESEKSSEASGTPVKPQTKPEAPTGLAASAGNAQATLNWNASEGAAEYRIYKATTVNGYGSTPLAVTRSLSYTATGLTNDTKYYFVVTAVNTAGESVRSSEVNATPVKPLSKPVAPQNLTGIADNAQVVLSWQAVEGASEYRVYSKTASGTYGAAIVTTRDIRYTVTGLTNGTVYNFVVSAVNSVGESERSNEVSAMPVKPLSKPDAAKDLKAEPGDKKVVLSWGSTANATSYRVYMGSSSGSYGQAITETREISYTVTGLKNAVKYYFVVTALNSAGEGEQSNEVNVKPFETVAPIGSINIKKEGDYTNKLDVVLSLSANDATGVGAMAFSNDGTTWSDWEAYATEKVYTLPTGDGSKTVYVKYKDLCGNESIAYAASVSLDTTAPNKPILTGTTPTNNVKPTWSWTTGGNDGSGTYRYKLDSNDLGAGATIATATSYTPTNDLNEGTHVLYVQEKDAAGNWSEVKSYSIVVDKTAVKITLTPSTVAPTNANVNIAVAVDKAVVLKKWLAGSKAAADFAGVGTVIAGSDFTVTTNGTYTVYVKDAAGNETVKEIVIGNIDKVLPVITLTPSPVDPTNGNVNIAVAVSKTVAVKKWLAGSKAAADFASVGTVIAGSDFTVSDNGTYTVYVKDTAGNEAVQTVTVSNIDKVVPIITLAQSPVVSTNGDVTVTVSISKTVVTKKWLSGSKAAADFASNGTEITGDSFVVTTNGTYTVYVKDAAGNEAVQTITVSNIDKITATITLTPSTVAPTNANVSIAVAVDKAVVLKKWLAGSKAAADFASAGTVIAGSDFTVSDNGTYTVYVKDAAGNETVKEIVIGNIDKVLPVITLTPSPVDPTNGNVTVTVALSKAVTVKKWLSGSKAAADFASAGTVIAGSDFTVSDNGTYTVYVKDAAGNEAVQTIAVSNIDKVVPIITLTQSPVDPTNGDVTVTVSVSKTVVTKKWLSGSKAAADFASNGTAITGDSFVVTTNGAYTVYVKDGAGNEAVTTITVSNIDKIAATITLTPSTVAPTNANVNIAVAVDKAVVLKKWLAGSKAIADFASAGTVIAGADFTVTTNGTYTVYVKDAAGNEAVKEIVISNITVAAPTFNVAGGTYTTAQTVTLSTATAGATIYYTTDGSTPTTSSTQYSGAITVSTTTTIKAIAVKTGWTNSNVESRTYTITGTVAAPTLSLAGGTYTTAQTVTLSTTTPGTTIYYTTDGSTPTTSSTQYTGAIIVPLNSTMTIKAIAVKTDWVNSSVASADYTITGTVAAPAFSVASGTYTTGQTVTLSTITPGATIYYTTDGSTPTTSSTQYTGAISVSATQSIKAIAVKTDWANSSVESKTYTITGTVATPTFSVGTGTYTTAQTVTLSTTTPGAAIYYTTDGSTPTISSTQYTGAITVTATKTIKAIALKTDWADSSIANADYTITGTVAAPSFSVAGGTYTTAQTVALSTTTPGATIYYTTDGSTPTASSTLYTGSITIALDSIKTIKAIAVKTDWANSSVASADYTITGTVSVPSFSVAGGKYNTAQNVTLSSTTTGATIFYTLDGTTPTSSSPQYTAPITVLGTVTLKALAAKAGWTDSSVASIDYNIPCLYVVNATDNTMKKIDKSTGNAVAFIDSSKGLNSPRGIISDGTYLYVVNSGNNTISKVNKATGVVTTLTSTGLNFPHGITGDGAYLYVANYNGNSISKIDKATGVETTLTSAGLSNPAGIVSDGTYLYVVNGGDYTVSRIDKSTGIATLLTGVDVSNPRGIMSDGEYLYVTNAGNGTIIKVNKATGAVTTLTGAGLSHPAEIASDGEYLYVADYDGNTISRVDKATGIATFLTGAGLSRPYGIYFEQVATPSFNVAGGTYSTAQTVTLSTPTEGASIYYTTDGSTPTTSSTPYTGAITVPLSSTMTIKAIAVKTDWADSNVVSADYTITGTVAAPTFSVTGGTYTTAQTVTLSTTTSGSTIYYTTDGSIPTISSTQYTGAITVPLNSNMTIKAIAAKAGWDNSSVASVDYTITGTVSVPSFSVAGGKYNTAQNVTLSSTTAGATIYYTLDGTTPTTSSPQYTAPITVLGTVTLKALAIKAGWADSSVASIDYNIPCLYVVNATDNTMKKIDKSTGNAVAFIDSSKGLNSPRGVLSDGTYLYVVNSGNNTISKVNKATGAVTPLTSTGLSMPHGIVDDDAYLYVTNYTANSISKIDKATGVATTLTSAGLSNPAGIVSDGTYLYVVNVGSNTISKVDKATGIAIVLTSAGMSGPRGILSDGTYLYVTNANTNTIIRVDKATGAVTTLASAGLSGPGEIASDGTYLYVSNWYDMISKVDKTTGVATMFTSAGLSNPYGIYFEQAAPPTLSVVGGTYKTAQTVTLNTITPGATIYYTTNGSTPTTSSAQYTGVITIPLDSTMTIKAITVKTDWADSSVVSETYTITGTVATPILSVATGTYTTIQTVTLSTTTPGATIYYTTDGSTPTTSSTQYTGAITVSATKTIKAIAVKTDWDNSSVASADYTINIPLADGSLGSPFLVHNIDELAKIGTGVDGWTFDKAYKLVNDLDFNQGSSYQSGSVNTAYTTGTGWTPICPVDPFSGNFEGDGHVIKHLYINNVDASSAGLFGNVGQGGVVKNLGLNEVNITGGYYVGSLAGIVYGANVENCSVTGIDVSTKVEGDYMYAGGLIGDITDGTGTSPSTITNCFATIPVKGADGTGGLIGATESPATGYTIINYSYATGDIIPIGYTTSNGGLIGTAGAAKLNGCYATGSVSGGAWTAGLIGWLNVPVGRTGEIKNSYAIGNVDSVHYIVAGLAGQISNANVVNCYTTNSVITNDPSGNAINVGGMLGKAQNVSISNSVAFNPIVSCTSYYGDLDGTNVNRIVGMVTAPVTITNSYAKSTMTVTYPGNTVTKSSTGVDGADITALNLASNEPLSSSWSLGADPDHDNVYWKLESGTNRPVLYVDPEGDGIFTKLGTDNGM